MSVGRIVFDDIIYRLQASGGISHYWTEITSRISGISDMVLHIGSSPSNALTNRIVTPITRYLAANPGVREPHIFHSSYYRPSTNRSSISVVTVHDFTYERFFPYMKRSVHHLQKSLAIAKADGIICVSNSTKHDFHEFYPRFDRPVAVIHNGVSRSFRSLPSSQVGKPYLVYVGGRKAYKNFVVVAEAFRKLRSAYRLVVIGGGPLTSEERRLLEACAGSENYIAAGNVAESELVRYYAGATALLYPSAYEGFGIPIVEAMRSGCPVVCARNSSLTEVGGDVAFYLNETTPAEIVRQVRAIESTDRHDLVVRGLKWSDQFSWDICADRTYEFYQTVWDCVRGGREV